LNNTGKKIKEPIMKLSAIKRIRAIIRKEFWHILRDWQTLIIIILMPVVMMFLYGYALTTDIKDLPVLVQDEDVSPLSRYLTGSIDASTIFRVDAVISGGGDVAELFKKYHGKVLFRFLPGLNRDVRNGGTPGAVQVFIDGSDQNVGTIIRNVVEPLIQRSVLAYLDIIPPKLVTVNATVLYNPEQKSALFFVPGLIVIILTMISTLLTSLTITREKERGTLEQLLVSPVKPWEIIIGKLIPYIFLSFFDGAIILVVGRINFGVTVTGSLLLLTAVTVVYIITALSLGLIFSTVAKTQQQAMMLSLPVTILPIIVLSGFIFPIASMPLFLQGIASIIPATYYLEIIRGIILKGVDIVALWKPLIVLSGIGFLFILISIRKFGAHE
jgi:ABC-2 type transport system permease protein